MNDMGGAKKETESLRKKLLLYLFLNSGAVNVFWWCVFWFGTHITSHKACFFNDVIAPKINNLYTLSVAGGLLFIIIGLEMLKETIQWWKKASLVGILLSIISPLFVAAYYILLYANKMADIPNLIVIPISLSLAYFNFFRSKPIIKALV